MADLKDFGFREVIFDVPVTAAQQDTLYKNFDLICQHVGLEGGQRKNLGDGASFAVRDGLDYGARGHVTSHAARIFVEIDAAFAGDANIVAHEMFHLLDGKLLARMKGSANPLLDRRGELKMFSDNAHAYPASELGQRILAVIGSDRDITAQASRELADFNKEIYPNPVERFFSFVSERLTRPPYWRRPTEQLARAFAWHVSGENPYPGRQDVARPHPFASSDNVEKLAGIAPLALQIAKSVCGEETQAHSVFPQNSKAGGSNRSILRTAQPA
jgi:hypothetical protein